MAPPSPTAPDADAPARFIARLRDSLADGSFSKLTLGRPHGTEPTLEKLIARRVQLRGAPHLSFVWRHRSKDITKNLPLDEAVAEVERLVASQFHHAHLLTRGHDIQLAWAKKGHWTLRIGKLAAGAASPAAAGAGAASPEAGGRPNAEQDAGSAARPDGGVDAGPGIASGARPDAGPEAHNRARHYALTLEAPFLAELGVTDAQHRLVPAMARKWRQINKFVEVLGHAFTASPLAQRDPAAPVRVLDFGAGKGYLTFAVHHHLAALGRVPQVTGVELRPDLTALCNGAASRLGLAGLQFATGDVRSHPVEPVDIMIALHACDTATDVAMHRGVRAGAAIILCSPCCHKELRPQMSAPPLLAPMLKHGIHMTEQAEMLTDALRALLLQAEGYDAQVFEFISPEHTSKNKMVLAVRRPQPLPAAQRQAILDQVAALQAHYGVRQQALARLLAADAAAPTAPAPTLAPTNAPNG